MFVARRSLALVRMFNSGKEGIEDVVKGRGRAQEDVYFSKKDKESLKKLMSKLDSAIADESSPDVLKKHRENLVGIMRKHNMRPSDSLIEDILTWKNSSQ